MKKTIKRIRGIWLSVCIAAFCVVNVYAKEEQTPVVYDSGSGYTAEKITHSEKDVYRHLLWCMDVYITIYENEPWA